MTKELGLFYVKHPIYSNDDFLVSMILIMSSIEKFEFVNCKSVGLWLRLIYFEPMWNFSLQIIFRGPISLIIIKD